MASVIKVDTIQSTTSNVIIQNSVGTEYARFDASGDLVLVNKTTFPAGTAAAPSITPTGDTNTGLFFSAADTIDFTEGGTATGQFDSSGNFKFNSGYGSVATAYGCRAWVNFNGTSTVAIRASGNVSSITDNGTGNYTVNFTTAMPDANFCVCASGGDPTSRDGGVFAPASQALTTSAVRVRGFGSNAPDTTYDLNTVCVSIFR